MVMNTEKKAPFEMTGAVLKWIALFSMLLNHVCYALELYLNWDSYFVTTAQWYLTRIAFMIFAFLIAEGMHYTHDRRKYIFSLFLFALLSEIPFDLCFSQAVYDPAYQNVFFTLGLGALAIAGIDYFKGHPSEQILSVAIASVISVYLNSDYDFLGVVTIAAFYAFRRTKWKQLLYTSLIFILFTYLYYLHHYAAYFFDGSFAELFISPSVWESVLEELHGLLALPLLVLYRGTRGRNLNKWFFYCFYPGHILLIWGILSMILCLS